MLILNAGIPRSGTILTNAIVRRIFEAYGQPAQSINLHHEDQATYLARLCETRQAKREHILIHTHFWNKATAHHIRALQPDVVVLANQRDPRDVCVSVAKMLDQPVDYTIRVVRQRVGFFTSMIADTGVAPFVYETFIQNQPHFVSEIAARLDRPVNDQTVADILQATSLNAHLKVMDHVRQSTDTTALNIARNKHRLMKEDKHTHITDRHIQSGAIGRWRHELAAQDKALVEEHLTPLAVELGYQA